VSIELLIEQSVNGLQLGLTLYLLAAGLTLIFGVMGILNLAHGSMYMVGAYAAAAIAAKTGSFVAATAGGAAAAGLFGLLVEFVIIRRLYHREHLDQVLATFGVILFTNEAIAMLFGRSPLFMPTPQWAAGQVEIFPGVPYPQYRLFVMAAGIVIAVLLWQLITRSRLGMQIRAGATHRDMVGALGVNIARLYTVVFGVGALLCGVAGALIGPVRSVQIGMGEDVLILTFVVVVIGGIGSLKGAFAGAMVVGIIDTLSRAVAGPAIKSWIGGPTGDSLAAGLSSIMVYLVMALVLVIRPTGLFPAAGNRVSHAGH
jgi:branched-chain amino acid transport system permease protein